MINKDDFIDKLEQMGYNLKLIHEYATEHFENLKSMEENIDKFIGYLADIIDQDLNDIEMDIEHKQTELEELRIRKEQTQKNYDEYINGNIEYEVE